MLPPLELVVEAVIVQLIEKDRWQKSGLWADAWIPFMDDLVASFVGLIAIASGDSEPQILGSCILEKVLSGRLLRLQAPLSTPPTPPTIITPVSASSAL